jgi:hypothetical protein
MSGVELVSAEALELSLYGSALTNIAPTIKVILSGCDFGVTMSAVPKTPKICWICGRVVYLEEAKTDASGLPVHESCYATKLKLVKMQQPIRKRPRS